MPGLTSLKDVNSDTVGVEFATSSVSSPGLEYYLNRPLERILRLKAAIVELVPDLKYANGSRLYDAHFHC